MNAWQLRPMKIPLEMKRKLLLQEWRQRLWKLKLNQKRKQKFQLLSLMRIQSLQGIPQDPTDTKDPTTLPNLSYGPDMFTNV